MTTSHLTNPAKDAGQVIGYSLPKDDKQVPGYLHCTLTYNQKPGWHCCQPGRVLLRQYNPCMSNIMV